MSQIPKQRNAATKVGNKYFICSHYTSEYMKYLFSTFATSFLSAFLCFGIFDIVLFTVAGTIVMFAYTVSFIAVYIAINDYALEEIA